MTKSTERYFQIYYYSVTLFDQKDKGDFYLDGKITCQGKNLASGKEVQGQRSYLYVIKFCRLKDKKELPKSKILQEEDEDGNPRTRIISYTFYDKIDSYIDILRSEGPVYCYFYPKEPTKTNLRTISEIVGEEDNQ